MKRYIKPKLLTPCLVGGVALALWYNIVDGTLGQMPVVFWAFFGTLMALSVVACFASAPSGAGEGGNPRATALRYLICTGAIYGIALTGWKYAGIAIFICAMMWLASMYRTLPQAPQKVSH